MLKHCCDPLRLSTARETALRALWGTDEYLDTTGMVEVGTMQLAACEVSVTAREAGKPCRSIIVAQLAATVPLDCSCQEFQQARITILLVSVTHRPGSAFSSCAASRFAVRLSASTSR